jgi:hypothetical protein
MKLNFFFKFYLLKTKNDYNQLKNGKKAQHLKKKRVFLSQLNCQ